MEAENTQNIRQIKLAVKHKLTSDMQTYQRWYYLRKKIRKGCELKQSEIIEFEGLNGRYGEAA